MSYVLVGEMNKNIMSGIGIPLTQFVYYLLKKLLQLVLILLLLLL